jgi:hypothetical protein
MGSVELIQEKANIKIEIIDGKERLHYSSTDLNHLLKLDHTYLLLM